jgi:hypothetical protein
MRSSLASLLLVLAVGGGGAAAAGCGSVAAQNDGGPGSDAPVETAPPTAAEACGQFASTFCSRLNGCAPFAAQLLYGDMTTCQSRVMLGCTRDLEVPDTSETTTDMVTCARDAANATCDDLLANNLPTSCQIKPGARLNGEGCGSSWQCMSTHCEKKDGDCGVCAPRAGAAGACSVDEGCTQGLVCAGQKCAMPGAMNAPCSDMAPCRANLYCSATSKTCATPLQVSAPCAGDASGCDLRHGLWCNTLIAAPRCEMAAVAKGGQSCGIVNGTITICVEGNDCQGACLAPAEDGQQCSDKVHCLPPANCVGGLCRLPSSAACAR